MKKPTAFAFAGDWHGNTHWAVNAIDAVAKAGGDAILHVGDYGFKFDSEFVDGVESACAENGVLLYFIDGNHDWHQYLNTLELDGYGLGIVSHHVRYIPRGHRWKWWGLDFMGLGGASSVDKDNRTPYVSWWPTEELTTADMYKAVYGDVPHTLEYGDNGKQMASKRVDVMIAHDCPTGVPIPGISFREGLQYFTHHALTVAESHRRKMREVFEEVKPKLYVHGHYHRLYVHEGDYGCKFVGLDMDGTSGEANLWLVRNPVDLVGSDYYINKMLEVRAGL